MEPDLSELLFNALNEQGYLFQEICWETLKSKGDVTGWTAKTYNYPVATEDKETKIDIILHSVQAVPELYAVVECKRANPERPLGTRRRGTPPPVAT